MRKSAGAVHVPAIGLADRSGIVCASMPTLLHDKIVATRPYLARLTIG